VQLAALRTRAARPPQARSFRGTPGCTVSRDHTLAYAQALLTAGARTNDAMVRVLPFFPVAVCDNARVVAACGPASVCVCVRALRHLAGRVTIASALSQVKAAVDVAREDIAEAMVATLQK
jgi:hypothetical protein